MIYVYEGFKCNILEHSNSVVLFNDRLYYFDNDKLMKINTAPIFYFKDKNTCDFYEVKTGCSTKQICKPKNYKVIHPNLCLAKWVELGNEINLAGMIVDINNVGDIIAIGSPNDSTAGESYGKVTLYRYDSGSNTWGQFGSTLYGSHNYAYFGLRLSLNSDGTIIAISESGSPGTVKTYTFNGVDWVQYGQNILGLDNDGATGYSVSLNGNGTVMAIGSKIHNIFTGRVINYRYFGGTWFQYDVVYGESVGDMFGWSVKLNYLGDVLIVGIPYDDTNANNCGKIYIYVDNGIQYTLTNSAIANTAMDAFGHAVDLNNVGDVFAASSPAGGYLTYGGITLTGNPSDYFGYSLSLNGDATRVAVGIPLKNAGAGVVKIYSGSNQLGADIIGGGPGGYFGFSVALNEVGDIVVVSEPYYNGGRVRVFKFSSL